MIELLDGVARGSVLACRRAPNWLRVTIDTAGNIDALDALDDKPRDDETVYVYELVEGTRSMIFACTRSRGGGGQYAVGQYRQLEGVGGDVSGEYDLRDEAGWRQWTADRAGVPLQVVLEMVERERAGG